PLLLREPLDGRARGVGARPSRAGQRPVRRAARPVHPQQCGAVLSQRGGVRGGTRGDRRRPGARGNPRPQPPRLLRAPLRLARDRTQVSDDVCAPPRRAGGWRRAAGNRTLAGMVGSSTRHAAGCRRRARVAAERSGARRARATGRERVKLAFVAARYGAEISGGPEDAGRAIAEQLSARHDVEVLTTCARDDETWKNEYPEGADRMRGVLVRRFAAAGTRAAQTARALAARLLAAPHTQSEESDWVRRIGPSAPGLI